jgi:hypothetical protein
MYNSTYKISKAKVYVSQKACRLDISMERNERIITIAIMAGLFGGLVGGPVASLVDYYAPRYERFELFIISEFIGFTCLGLMVYFGRRKAKTYDG